MNANANDTTEESPINITAVIPDAKPGVPKDITVVEYERNQTRYTAYIVRGESGLEIDRLAWENFDHSDYGTKIVMSVDDDVRAAVLDAAAEVSDE
jgi:hypothetical protein